MVPSVAMLIERTSAGSPHGVYHFLRPSAVSNDSIADIVPFAKRSRCACSVPMRRPLVVGARHVASGPAIAACSSQPWPSYPLHRLWPSTITHVRPASRASAVTSRAGSFSTGSSVSPRNVKRPPSVPTRIRVSISIDDTPEEMARFRKVISPHRSGSPKRPSLERQHAQVQQFQLRRDFQYGSIAAPVSTGYVVLAVALSGIFLKEQVTLVRGIGIVLTIVGVAILSV